jgi:hypothetical protein
MSGSPPSVRGRSVVIAPSNDNYDAIAANIEKVIAEVSPTVITLERGALNLKSAKALATAIQKNMLLTDSLFSYPQLLQFLNRSNISSTLKRRDRGIESIILDGNCIDSNVAKIIKRMMDQISAQLVTDAHNNLQHLPFAISLSGCDLTDATAAILLRFAKGIESGKVYKYQFEMINLSGNDLTDRTITSTLCPYLTYNGNVIIKRLNLAHNNLTDISAELIEKCLQQNIVLLGMDLQGNKITSQWLSKIEQHLADNNAIAILQSKIKDQKLNLADIEINDDLIRQLFKLLHCRKSSFKEIDFASKPLAPAQADLFEKNIRQLKLSLVLSNIKDLTAHPRLFHRQFNIKLNNLLYKRNLKIALFLIPYTVVMISLAVTNSLFALTWFLTLFAILPLIDKYSSNYEDKIDKLEKAPEWEERDIAEVALGRSCQTSYSPWFTWRAWTSAAANIAYITKPEEQLTPVDYGNINAPKIS